MYTPAHPKADCTSLENKEALNTTLRLKKEAFESISFNRIMQEALPPEEKPCTTDLYTRSLENNNYWLKFYCDIIADTKGYSDYSKSLRLKLLEDKKLLFIDTITLALEYARFNKLEMTDKLFARSVMQMNQCPILREFIWSPDAIYLITKLKEFYPAHSKKPTSENEIKIKRFSKLVHWTLTLYPNFDGKTIITSTANELLLRNAQYYESKLLKDFSLNQSRSFGFYGIDLFELYSIYNKEVWTLKVLIFILPLFFVCLLSKLKSIAFNQKHVRRAFTAFMLLLISIMLLIIDMDRNGAIIKHISNAPVEFKSGLLQSPSSALMLEKMVNATRSPYSKFLMALYYQNNGELLKAIEIYESILAGSHINSALKIKVLNNVGTIFYYTGDVQQARSYFSMALEINKNHAASLYNLYLLTGDTRQLNKALDKDKNKVIFLKTYEPLAPSVALLDYKELTKIFCMDKSYGNLIKGIFFLSPRSTREELYVEIELLVCLLIMIVVQIFSRKPLLIDESSSGQKPKRWYRHIINILLPGNYFIQSGRFILGIVFMFGFFISTALFYNLYSGESELLSKFVLVRDWTNILRADDFTSAPMINPILYSVCLYFIFLTYLPNMLISLLGMDLEKK